MSDQFNSKFRPVIDLNHQVRNHHLIHINQNHSESLIKVIIFVGKII